MAADLALIEKHLPSKKHLKAFAQTLLESLSDRTLEQHHPAEWASFIEARFEFFMQSFTHQQVLKITEPSSEQPWLANHQILETLYPDAAHLFITVESVFRELGIRVTRKFHPMIGFTQTSQGKLKSVIPPQDASQRMSYVYIEFQKVEDPALLQLLSTELQERLQMVQQTYQDQPALLQKLNDIKQTLSNTRVSTQEPLEEWLHLMDWLRGSFYLFGYAEYTKTSGKGKASEPIQSNPQSHLGILASEPMGANGVHILNTLNAHVWRMQKHASDIVFDTIQAISPIQRFDNLMRLSIRVSSKQKTTEHVFLGLLRRSSLQTNNLITPLIHLKIKYIGEAKKMLQGSYNYNQVIRLFRDIPKFELFRCSSQDLLQMVDHLTSITNPNELYCFFHHAQIEKYFRWTVVIPHEHFSHQNNQKILAYLSAQVPHTHHEMIEIRGDDMCRLHIYFYGNDNQTWEPDMPQIEADLRELIKSWEDLLRSLIEQQYSGRLSEQLASHYIQALPEHYRARTTPSNTIQDILYLERMSHEGEVLFNFTRFDDPNSELSGKVSLLHMYSPDKVHLVTIMPILENAGLQVIDQLTARVGLEGKTFGYIQSFRVLGSNQTAFEEHRYQSSLVELLGKVFSQQTENDPLNALCLFADLNWRAINVMQTYRNLYKQVNRSYSASKINQTLLTHADISKMLFEYFEAKFSTDASFGDKAYRLKVVLPQKEDSVFNALRSVKEVAADVILRQMFELMKQTLRTSFYLPKKDTSISIKLDSKSISFMPIPQPYREIYVHDVGMEGVHLRFGAVARGGLRWSDRLDDFRTEVLGLVKTQQTKNVVIVPVGSKGGFVIKKQGLSREEAAQESQKQYQHFIRALLDITDNVDAKAQVRHPNHVLAYDDLDPYLVVAADKGTATFSDVANHISEDRRFWLGDAFASGGSVGYDHKKEGITARGAWECVKLHFKEMGHDIQTEPTSVAGIGDMSGDVFGNGMLLSQSILLKAAFNHMHIFLDPNPDASKSWNERKRLFELPRSTWDDYNRSLISDGGGIYDRHSKEIHLSDAVKKMLDLGKNVVNGAELIRAILKMRVDLLWFGGIGTYIKAAPQSHMNVGDQSNDDVRIDVEQCRAKVIGEGANLGLTQLARIFFSYGGGRLNTDAIDNSAGVNMSDYEVNIKILLQRLLQQKVLPNTQKRNEVLAKATDEVSELVLKNNRGQHRLISMDSLRSQKQFKVFRHLIQYLSKVNMNPRSEYIPTDADLNELETRHAAMPRPVLAVLQAYVKMFVFEALLESDFLDHEYFEQTYIQYFPETLIQKFGKKAKDHKLKREIIGTQITNKIVNQAGIVLFFRLQQLTNASIADIAKVYLILDASLRASELRQVILESDSVSEDQKYHALIEQEMLLKTLSYSFTQRFLKVLDFNKIPQYQKLFDDLLKTSGASSKGLETQRKHWQKKGFSKDAALRLAQLKTLSTAPDVFFLHYREKLAIEPALSLAMLLQNTFDLEWTREKVRALRVETDWELAHQDILLNTIELNKLKLLKFVLPLVDKKTLKKLTSKDLLKLIQSKTGNSVNVYYQTLKTLKSQPTINLSTLTVSVNGMGFLESD